MRHLSLGTNRDKRDRDPTGTGNRRPRVVGRERGTCPTMSHLYTIEKNPTSSLPSSFGRGGERKNVTEQSRTHEGKG